MKLWCLLTEQCILIITAMRGHIIIRSSSCSEIFCWLPRSQKPVKVIIRWLRKKSGSRKEIHVTTFLAEKNIKEVQKLLEVKAYMNFLYLLKGDMYCRCSRISRVR